MPRSSCKSLPIWFFTLVFLGFSPLPTALAQERPPEDDGCGLTRRSPVRTNAVKKRPQELAW